MVSCCHNLDRSTNTHRLEGRVRIVSQEQVYMELGRRDGFGCLIRPSLSSWNVRCWSRPVFGLIFSLSIDGLKTRPRNQA